MAEELRISLTLRLTPSLGELWTLQTSSQQVLVFNGIFLDGTGLGFQMAMTIEGTSSGTLSLVVKFRGLEKVMCILRVSWGSLK